MEKRLEENNVKNENDRKKTYLRAYRKHGKRIKRIESEIEEIRNMKMYPSSNNDGMPHGSNQSDLSSYAAALQEREDKLYQEGIKQVQTYKDIEYRINELDDQDERDVMFYRYIKGFEWWQIAQLMEYSESWIYELHGRALKKIQINERVEFTGVLLMLIWYCRKTDRYFYNTPWKRHLNANRCLLCVRERNDRQRSKSILQCSSMET